MERVDRSSSGKLDSQRYQGKEVVGVDRQKLGPARIATAAIKVSVFRLCQLAAPHMAKAGGGAILNITSMAGDNKNQKMASYASAKAAESHLTRNIAFDLGPMKIRVNGVAPGATRTHALQTVLTPEIEATMLKHTPSNRLGEPADMANAALFLCSPAASWISGQILTVSGGGVQELD
jgi:7-alpha-hydroxysteroid dehydrogenase